MYPLDADVAFLLAESLMNLSPWKVLLPLLLLLLLLLLHLPYLSYLLVDVSWEPAAYPQPYPRAP